jgi:hypothetical protein
MEKFSKSEIIFIVALVILIVVVYAVRGGFDFSKGNYAAVYLITGDIYFGKLVQGFNWFKLSDVFFIQRSEKGDLNLNSFKDAFWKPSEPLNIKKDKVIFWAYLEKDSPVVQAIEQRKAAEQALQQTQGEPQQQTQPPQTQTPTTPKTPQS